MLDMYYVQVYLSLSEDPCCGSAKEDKKKRQGSLLSNSPVPRPERKGRRKEKHRITTCLLCIFNELLLRAFFAATTRQDEPITG